MTKDVAHVYLIGANQSPCSIFVNFGTPVVLELRICRCSGKLFVGWIQENLKESRVLLQDGGMNVEVLVENSETDVGGSSRGREGNRFPLGNRLTKSHVV